MSIRKRIKKWKIFRKSPLVHGHGVTTGPLAAISQLKTVIDRFCAYNSSLNRKHLKSALLAVAWNTDDWTFDALEAHYRTLVRYINFVDRGMVLGYGCGSPSMTKHSGYPEQAYRLGLSL